MPDHETLIGKLVARLSPRGQLAVQLPSDDYNSARTIFADVAGWRYELATLDIGAYAQLLYARRPCRADSCSRRSTRTCSPTPTRCWNGPRAPRCYPISSACRRRSTPPYLEEVRRRLHARYPERPVFFPFRRIIFYARRA